ncbi:MAG: SDR family oxidoreductase [Ruminococcaceae bacterium]|nr:SDR family oxidoreductase [Oscillospiraceae bacterium]
MINIDFSGKNVLITGAGGGIAAGIDRSYAKAGAKVHLADMDVKTLEKPAAELKAMGCEVVTHTMDVTDEAMVQKVIDDIVAADGKLDMLCNAAGIISVKNYMDDNSEMFEKILAVNLVGMHKCTQAALRHMLPAGAGKIVNIASASSRKGVASMTFYSASKFGVVSLTQSVALTVAEKGINVNAICPGMIESNMTPLGAKHGNMTVEEYIALTTARIPMGHFQTADDIGNAAVFLCSDMAVNITGQALNVDGAMNMN